MGDQYGERRPGGVTGDLPWSSVFDSAANLRAMSAIQAEGLRAASELVDRFVRFAANGLNSTNSATDPAVQNERADLYGATDIAPLIRSWLPMWGLQSLVPPAAPESTPPGSARAREAVAGACASMDLELSEATGPLKLETTAPGIASAELWLHNRGMTDFGDVKIGCASIVADSGRAIDDVAVTFDPSNVPMPARSSRGIAVGVEVGHDIDPGVYRGLIVVEGHPQLCVPIVVTIHAEVS
ncbi:hypothetical protein BH09ACT7_BH09ACT7_56860 [soil metagenome]